MGEEVDEEEILMDLSDVEESPVPAPHDQVPYSPPLTQELLNSSPIMPVHIPLVFSPDHSPARPTRKSLRKKSSPTLPAQEVVERNSHQEEQTKQWQSSWSF